MTSQLERKFRQEQEAETEKQFDSSPIWVALQKISSALKAWYSENDWVWKDYTALATLETMRAEYETDEEKIRIAVEKEKAEAYERIEQSFGRMHDKLILKLQLRSTKKELDVVTKMGTLRAKANANG